jgi:hypothetical protein
LMLGASPPRHLNTHCLCCCCCWRAEGRCDHHVRHLLCPPRHLPQPQEPVE